MPKKKHFINETPFPDYAIETVARCLWPDLLAFFQSEEGQREFEEWKKSHAAGEAEITNEADEQNHA